MSDPTPELSGITKDVYQELRRRAQVYLPQHGDQLSLQATELVHEACLRILKNAKDIQDRNHLIALAARAMRQVLIDEVRSRQTQKRGDLARNLTITIAQIAEADVPVDVLELDAALNQLAQISERAARLVELRFFGGLTREEAAEVLKVSRTTVERDWTTARLWLRRKLVTE